MPIYIYVIYLLAAALFIALSVFLERDRKRIGKLYEKAIDGYVAIRVELEQGYFDLYNSLYEDHTKIKDQLVLSCAPEEFITFFNKGCNSIYTVLARVAAHIETSVVSDPLYAKKMKELSKK